MNNQLEKEAPKDQVRELETNDLINRFNYHRPAEASIPKFAEIRGNLLAMALMINKLVPAGPERAKSIRKLEEAMFWANAGIARNQPPEVQVPTPGV